MDQLSISIAQLYFTTAFWISTLISRTCFSISRLFLHHHTSFYNFKNTGYPALLFDAWFGRWKFIRSKLVVWTFSAFFILCPVLVLWFLYGYLCSFSSYFTDFKTYFCSSWSKISLFGGQFGHGKRLFFVPNGHKKVFFWAIRS